MLRFVIGRLLGGIFLMLALTFVTFLIFLRIPVDPASYVAYQPTVEQRAQINRELGVDKPVVVQWAKFVKRLVAERSLGDSVLGYGPVNSIIQRSAGATLSLAAGGVVLLLLLALPIGMLSALRAQSLFDRGVVIVAIVGIVLHPFVIGLLFRALFAKHWGIAPDTGYCDLRAPPSSEDVSGSRQCGGLADWANHLWLPWLTFAIFFLPLYTRMIRARVIENLGAHYVTTARAKGASDWRIVTRHVLRNATGPLLAMVATDIGTVLTAAIYIETIYALPGLGYQVILNLDGGHGYDLTVLVGIVFVVAATITLFNTLADIAAAALDPRVRLGRS